MFGITGVIQLHAMRMPASFPDGAQPEGPARLGAFQTQVLRMLASFPHEALSPAVGRFGSAQAQETPRILASFPDGVPRLAQMAAGHQAV